MIAAADVVLDLLDRKKTLTDEDRAIVDDWLDAAVAWQAGELPLADFKRHGGATMEHRDGRGAWASSPGYARFVALWHAKRDPRWPALRDAVEALAALDRTANATRFGIIETDDLVESECDVHRFRQLPKDDPPAAAGRGGR